MIAVGQLAWVVRALFYAWMPRADYVLFVEPLHGVTFALVWTAAIHETARIAPEGMKNSAQAVLGMTFMGLGPSFAVFVAGYLFDVVGYRLCFAGFAVLVAGMLVVFWVGEGVGGGEQTSGATGAMRSGRMGHVELHTTLEGGLGSSVVRGGAVVVGASSSIAGKGTSLHRGFEFGGGPASSPHNISIISPDADGAEIKRTVTEEEGQRRGRGGGVVATSAIAVPSGDTSNVAI